VILEVFPVPIYLHRPKLEESFAIQHEIKKALPNIIEQGVELPADREAKLKTNVHLVYNTITDHNLSNLGEYIKAHTYKYFKETQAFFRQDARMELARSWVNIYDNEEAQEWHSHGDAFISGTYYYKCTGEDDNGQISLRQPGVQMRGGMFPIGNKYQVNLDVTPQEGGIILFPGWMEHRVRPNKTNDTRISISFDWFVNNHASNESIYIGKV
jgi:uncharacterized protein (TIGR02466 family)|tara:strand:+ start:886 stop:1524 length:639 start_codon:yes stop_codon:yes gene_type:complete